MRKFFNIKILTILILLVSLASCSSEELTNDNNDSKETGSTFFVSAQIAKHAQSRAYQEKGRVEEGIYNLTFLQQGKDNDNYNVATVNFNKEGTDFRGLGIVTLPGDQELKWQNVSGSPATFYLDNVGAIEGSDKTTIDFQDGKNPYIAAVFDSINGTNDLLWSSETVVRNTKTIHFDLHHNMSRVRVYVEVNHTSGAESIDLKNAKVEITNLFLTPKSYNRIDGTLTLDETKGHNEPLVIVDPDNTEEEGARWLKIQNEEENKTTYLSTDIVLPPQDLLGEDDRPRLVITLKDGTVYSGILPHAMLIAYGDSEDLTYPVALSFLKEHILTIRTVITEEPPTLAFMPVWVVDWVDKGNFTLEAHQAGIYTASEFKKLISYYHENDEYNLFRYGRLHTPETTKIEEWIFDFFSSVTLEYEDIYGKMNPNENGKKDFSFTYNNYSISVRNGNGTAKSVNTDQLYKIVTGQLDWDKLQQ